MILIDGVAVEGYWQNNHHPDYPMPVAQAERWQGRKLFLERLGTVELRAERTQYRGFSTCRICSKINGSSEFSLNNWRWPIGLRHYVEEHNVEPSAEFKAFVKDNS